MPHPKFFGKYRGEVTNPIDPEGRGRIQVRVPDVLGSGGLNWAMPCMPWGGDGIGFFAVPPIGARVWVEFEAGDPDYPIWAGCFWDAGQCPVPPGPQQMLTQALVGNGYKVEVQDLPGAPTITIEATLPAGTASIVINPAALSLTFGNSAVEMTAASVAVNGTALTVSSI